MRKGFTIEKKTFHNISLGQGQEKVAEDAIELSSKMGHWVMLQVSVHHSRYLPIYNIFASLLFNYLCFKECAFSTKMVTNIT